MALKKSPGPPLTSIFKGVVDAIPLRWRTKLGITRVVQKQPTDVAPDSLTSTLVASSVEQELTDERKKTNVTLDDPTGKTMVEYIRTKEGQVGTRTVSYVPEGTTAPSFNELTQEFSQEASGNGWSEQILVTVPNLFGGYDYSIERRDNVPPEFGALLQTRETSHTEAGTASLPTLGTGELMRREQQLDVQTKRVTVRDRDIATLPKSLVDKDTNNEKQVVTVTKTWQVDTTSPPPPDSLTDVKLNRLGDGTSIQTVLGVLNVFGGRDYKRERPDRVPPDFGALLQATEFAETVAGTASDPTLGTGELSREEKQVTEFTKRVTVSARDVSSLPKTIVNYDTSRVKQVITITRIWELDTATPTVPTATLDVSFEKLGDGTAIETRKSEAVFPGPVYGISIENLIPPKLSAGIPKRTSEITSIGTANSNPTLSIGELSHEEQQVDAFNKRTKSVSFGTITPPISIFSEELTDKFGGGLILTSITIDVAGTWLAVSQGFKVIESQLIQLGNGYDILITSSLVGDYAFQFNSAFDKEMQVQVQRFEQVVIPATVPNSRDYYVDEVRSLDKYKSKLFRTNRHPTAISEATALLRSEFGPYQFPGLVIPYGNGGYYQKRATARLVEHLIKTWWVKSDTKPSVPFVEIITDTCLVTALNDITKLEYAHDVLHDAISLGSIFFPATSPSYSQYAHGNVIGSTLTDFISLYAPGSGYIIGQTINIAGDGGSVLIRVVQTGIGGSVLDWTPKIGTFGWREGLHGPYGLNAQFYVTGFSQPRYDGKGMIGNWIVIDADVQPTDIPKLWKIETKSVIAR